MANLVRTLPSVLQIPSIWDDDEDWQLLSTASHSGLSIAEDDKHIYVEAAVPGIKPEDVEVTFDKGILYIRGEAKEEELDKKKKYYRKATSSFSYRAAVPGEIDPNTEPVAECTNGVMKITFAKSLQMQPKRIQVTTK